EPIERERKMGIRERKEDGFRAFPDSDSFQCWKTFFQESNQAAMLRELQNREMSGRAFNFRSEWPSSQFPRRCKPANANAANQRNIFELLHPRNVQALSFVLQCGAVSSLAASS